MQRSKRVEAFAAATLAYAAMLLVVVGPDPWMWTAWSIIGAILAAVVAAVLFVQEGTPWPQGLRRMVPGVAATMTFAVVAILAAALETRGGDNINRDYTLLAVGMGLSTALFLASYDRRRGKAAQQP